LKKIYKIEFSNLLDLFVSGGRDGRLILWDYRIGKTGGLQITDCEINDMKEICKQNKIIRKYFFLSE